MHQKRKFFPLLSKSSIVIRKGILMHLADGVLSTPVIVSTYALTVGALGYGAKGLEDEEIPTIALMAGTFFAVSLISIPVPPTSVHPLLCGLIGILLGKRAPLAFLPALFLQALLFRHGGLSALGANTLMLSIPAYVSWFLFRNLPIKNISIKGVLIGALSVIMTLAVLIGLLALTDPRFSQGDFSVVRIVTVGHLPLVLAEAFVTSAALTLIHKVKPRWLFS